MVNSLTPAPASRAQQPAASMDEVVIPMTHGLLQEAMQKAADRATATARAQATRELKQSLDAQAAALADERDELVKKLRIEWEDQAIHRVRAARLWSALVAFAVGAISISTIMVGLERSRLAQGADVGIDAMAKSRMLEDLREGYREPREELPCTDENGCAPGQRTQHGTVFRTPEPPDAPERR